MKKAIVLFSGGLDSTTVLAYALSNGFDVTPLTFSYGQRHLIETEKAMLTLKKYGLEKKSVVFETDLGVFSKCSLLNRSMSVPDMPTDKIPDTYVPSRNIIFLSIAAGIAETIDAGTIFIGVNTVDYSGYPDCRPEFINKFNEMIAVGTKMGVESSIKVEAPLINMSKKNIIALGLSLNVDYSITHSCYDPDDNGKSCGKCDSCRLRLSGFKENGMKDPLDYI
jgi:7-cyano-7-deazaguanine synthase